MIQSVIKSLMACVWMIPIYLHGQVSIPGDIFNDIDKLNDTTTLVFYESVGDAAESFNALPIYSKLSYNTAYPRGYNDGAVWKGKGATFELHGGVSYRKSNFSFTFYPVVTYSQNSDYTLSPTGNQNINPLRYKYGNGIDFVQRFGYDPFFQFHPGQSEIRFSPGKFIASISTQNYSVGPAKYNPIVLSRQGAGFPHLRLGSEPFDVRFKDLNIGKMEVNFQAGLLAESKYFDNNPLNDDRYFNSLYVGFSPSILPNLSLGFNKTLYKDTRFFEPLDLISVIHVFDSGERGDSINTNDTFDQLASATASWNFPEVNFRAYAEFAKNDFTGNVRWTLSEPEHSRAYTIGFEKVVALQGEDFLRLTYEHTNLSKNHTYLWRAEPSFYIHHINPQGYTHNGQLLGAGIGPGGNSDHFEMLYKKNDVILNFLFQRMEFNKDFFIQNIQGITNHDVEYSLSFNVQKKTPYALIGFESTYSYNMKRYFVTDQINFYFALSSQFNINKN